MHRGGALFIAWTLGVAGGNIDGVGVGPAGGEAWAVPPLSETQRAVLIDGTTDDDGELLQPGVYALLGYAAAWDAGDERGAAVPDVATLYADPSSHRGEAVLIEGELLRAGTRRADRAGPWGERVGEWVVRFETTDEHGNSEAPGEHAADAVATLLFPDPEGETERARPGRAVRTPARFYKVWRTTNTGTAGGDARFLVFVGPTPTVDTPTPSDGTGAGAWLPAGVMFALVFLGLVAFRVLQRSVGKRARPARRDPRSVSMTRAPSPRDAFDDGDTPDVGLPADPAEALRALADADHGGA